MWPILRDAGLRAAPQDEVVGVERIEWLAGQLGGNAVVNIVSYYKKNTTASTTDYVCHAGNFVAIASSAFANFAR